MEFYRQEYWNRLPFPSPGYLPNPGTEPGSSTLQAGSLHLSHQGRPSCCTLGDPGLSNDKSMLLFFPPLCLGLSLVVQVVMNLPAMWETQLRSWGWEDPLEEEIVTLSSILAWRITWTEKGGLQSMGSQRVRHDWMINIFTCMLLLNVFSGMYFTY